MSGSDDRWVRVPRYALDALAAGDWTFAQFGLAVCLAGTVNPFSGERSVRLSDLQRETSWPWGGEKLRLDLHGLDELGVIDFEAGQGRRRHRIRFTARDFGIRLAPAADQLSIAEAGLTIVPNLQRKHASDLEVHPNLQRIPPSILEVTSNGSASTDAATPAPITTGDAAQLPTLRPVQQQQDPQTQTKFLRFDAAGGTEGKSVEPAAAELDQPPREREVRDALEQLRDHDRDSLGVVLPLATQLPRELFFDVVERNCARIRTGSVRNHTGSLIKLLQIAVNEAQRRAAEQLAAAAVDRSPEDVVVFDASSYALGKSPWSVAAELLERKLRREYPQLDAAARSQLLALAQRAYDEAQAA